MAELELKVVDLCEHSHVVSFKDIAICSAPSLDYLFLKKVEKLFGTAAKVSLPAALLAWLRLFFHSFQLLLLFASSSAPCAYFHASLCKTDTRRRKRNERARRLHCGEFCELGCTDAFGELRRALINLDLDLFLHVVYQHDRFGLFLRAVCFERVGEVCEQLRT